MSDDPFDYMAAQMTESDVMKLEKRIEELIKQRDERAKRVKMLTEKSEKDIIRWTNALNKKSERIEELEALLREAEVHCPRGYDGLIGNRISKALEQN